MHATEAVQRALDVVDRCEPTVHAWAFLDPDRARAEAAAVDRHQGDSPAGPLDGTVLGVKDVFDTADQPTEYGSPIFAGHRPAADASAVALLRAGGAVVLGKTVTAEMACTHPGPTTNPHRATHTPGGSSMGSAAAVAVGMADIAIGTQTAGSVLRPASFCGVYGFKPTFGTVSTAGMKPVAPSLDTVGWFARDSALLDAVRVCLTGRTPMPPPGSPPAGRPPRIGLCRTEQWDQASADTHRAIEEAAALAASGADVLEAPFPERCVGLAAAHPEVMAFEAARSLAWEQRTHPADLSDELQSLLDLGRSIDPRDYDRIRARRDDAFGHLDELFGSADVLLTPAVVGEAPEGLGSTGDPRFNRFWTLLGLPSATVPGATGATGLPVGVQLVARPGHDALLLWHVRWLGERRAEPGRGWR